MGALVIYDITKQRTYESIERWLSELYDHAHPRVVVMLVGNKTDMESDRSVTTEEAKQYAGTPQNIHPQIHLLEIHLLQIHLFQYASSKTPPPIHLL